MSCVNWRSKWASPFLSSPTQTVLGDILAELTPVRHTPMLSADKTKLVEGLVRFAREKDVLLSWKIDVLTLVLRYDGGQFRQAITRGRESIIGEDVTLAVRTFLNVPLTVPDTEPFGVWGTVSSPGRISRRTTPISVKPAPIRAIWRQ